MYICMHTSLGLPGGSDGKEAACNAGDLGSIPGGIGRRRAWQPAPTFLPTEVSWTKEPGGLRSRRVSRD